METKKIERMKINEKNSLNLRKIAKMETKKKIARMNIRKKNRQIFISSK